LTVNTGGASHGDRFFLNYYFDVSKDMTLMTDTLWLCQNSYGKLPICSDFSIKHGDFP